MSRKMKNPRSDRLAGRRAGVRVVVKAGTTDDPKLALPTINVNIFALRVLGRRFGLPPQRAALVTGLAGIGGAHV